MEAWLAASLRRGSARVTHRGRAGITGIERAKECAARSGRFVGLAARRVRISLERRRLADVRGPRPGVLRRVSPGEFGASLKGRRAGSARGADATGQAPHRNGAHEYNIEASPPILRGRSHSNRAT